MSKEELIKQYQKDVENLRNSAKALNLSDEEVNKIFSKCFKALNKKLNSSNPNNNAKAQTYISKISKIFFCLLFFTIFIYVLLNVHQPTSSIVLRNVQGLIYPGLKVLRFLSVPILKKVPSLTDLYDETCLVENPYFYVSDMECWPCENVHSVIDLTGFNNHSLYQSGIPYIVKTKQKEVPFESIKETYLNNKSLLKSKANHIKSNTNKIRNIEDLFNSDLFVENSSTIIKSSKAHVSWRINKMEPGRILRTLFPRPYIISEWSGQSIERYIMFDEPKAKLYNLPNTECSYVFVIQASGERTIILKPSKECIKQCKTVSVVLKPSYVLWYNWWYWRPVSLPAENATDPSITYISSYC